MFYVSRAGPVQFVVLSTTLSFLNLWISDSILLTTRSLGEMERLIVLAWHGLLEPKSKGQGSGLGLFC